jgi:predicted nuclease of restriction endonuclease-like (RecB) superfamily
MDITRIDDIEGYKDFLEELKTKIRTSQLKAARAVNTELIMLYWHIGHEILNRQEKQGWGSKVVDKLSKDLSNTFSDMKGFSTRNLKYMRLFAETYPELEFVQQVAAQLPWFHIATLLDKVKTSGERLFYMNKSIENGWSRSILSMQIELNLYRREGMAVTNFSSKLPPLQSELAIQTLKDPYCFDFLRAGNEAHEREIEKELINHIQKFLLELGAGFAFVGRQYHLEVGNEDFYIDLLFYHLKLRSYVVIELKATKFKPEYAGKLNFYLSVVDDQLRHETDNPSIGIILCKQKDRITAEYALKGIDKPIGISEYRLLEELPDNLKTGLPTIEELEAELNKEILQTQANEKKK